MPASPLRGAAAAASLAIRKLKSPQAAGTQRIRSRPPDRDLPRSCRLRPELTHLGEAFGRDRTTIRHACFRIEDARDDFSLDRALSILEGALRLHAQCIPSGEAQ
jgi:hypothetical protein